MIKIQELSHGSWVMTPEGEMGVFVGFDYSTGKADIRVPNRDGFHGYTYSIDDLEPIPLTAEIMGKAGFKRLGKYGWYRKSLIVHHRKRGFVINKRYGVISGLHHLQTLTLALTGEILEVEL